MADRDRSELADKDAVASRAAEDHTSSEDSEIPEAWIEEIANSDCDNADTNVNEQSLGETGAAAALTPRAVSEWITDAGRAYSPSDTSEYNTEPATYAERIDRLKERGVTLKKKRGIDDQNGFVAFCFLAFAVAAVLTWAVDISVWFWGSAWVITGMILLSGGRFPDYVPDEDLRREERRLRLPSPAVAPSPLPEETGLPGGYASFVVFGGVIGMAILAAVVLLSGDDGASPSERPSPSVSSDAWEDCMDPWDGNHNGFEDQVRALLNDPRSMDTISTWVSRLREDGTHRITMDYTARNALGGTVRTTAHGNLDPTTCAVRVTEFGF